MGKVPVGIVPAPKQELGVVTPFDLGGKFWVHGRHFL
jgi:hypothetical protein